jgi:hypothetical protein
LRITFRIALVLLIGPCSQARAQDPGIEISDQANRAVARVEALWAPNKANMELMRKREEQERTYLTQTAQQAQIPIPNRQPICSSGELNTNEKAALIGLNGNMSAFRTALSSERQQLGTLNQRYKESVAGGDPYVTRISLYEKLVWSSTRLKMMLFLFDAFGSDMDVIQMSIDSTCLARKIISSGLVQSQETANILREVTSDREAHERSMFTATNRAYGDVLDIIMSMP